MEGADQDAKAVIAEFRSIPADAKVAVAKSARALIWDVEIHLLFYKMHSDDGMQVAQVKLCSSHTAKQNKWKYTNKTIAGLRSGNAFGHAALGMGVFCAQWQRCGGCSAQQNER